MKQIMSKNLLLAAIATASILFLLSLVLRGGL